MRRRALVLALSLSAAAGAGEPTQAIIERAQEQMDAVKYDEALSSAYRGVEAGEASPQQLPILYWILGQAAAVLNRGSLSNDALGKALELAPGLALAPGASPKISAPVERARARASPSGLRLELETHRVRSDTFSSIVSVHNDAFHLVDRIELEVQLGKVEERLGFASGAPWTLSWRCPSPPCAYMVTARDLRGNRLRELGSRGGPLLALGPPPVPLYREPRAYWVVSSLLAAAGVVLAIEFAHNQNALADALRHPQSHTLSEAQTFDSRRAQMYPWMISVFSGAGASGVAGVILRLSDK